MKKIFLLSALCVFMGKTFAQKETFDIVSYTPPNGWQKEVTENTTNYIISNKTKNSWCQLGIVKSTNSKGSIEQDFDSEWQGLIVKNYKPTGTPQLDEVKDADGWKIKSGATTFSFNKSDAIAMLTTASGFNLCVSIVATTNSEDYLKDIESFLSSVDLIKPETNVQSPTNNIYGSIVGTWGISSTVASYTNMSINEGSIVTQYTFNANGTYSFYIKTFRYQLANLLLTRETGIYQISGNNITISPQKSVIESWSKKVGTDDWGQLLSSQKRDLEKISYQFFTQDLGLGPMLVLKAGAITKRDGPFNNSEKDAWLYPSKTGVDLLKLPGGQQLTAEATQNEPVKQTATDNNSAISGIWSKTSSARVASGDPDGEGAGGYTTDQYTFNANGTYSFLSKTFRMNMNKLILVKENGTYIISGTTLTIDPKNSVTQSWSKSGGVDKWGSLLSSQNRTLEKASYTFTKHYFSGIGIWNLVLQSNKPTVRDGAFSNNTTFSNAWYFSPISFNNPVIELPGN